MQSVLEGISRDAGFKSEVLKAQDMHHTTLNRESERLANDVSKVRSEIRCPEHALPSAMIHGNVLVQMPSSLLLPQNALLVCRYEVEKLTASQRLDLNLEKGRMRDELQVMSVAGIITCASSTCDGTSSYMLLGLMLAVARVPSCHTLQALRDKSNELEIKIDKEINALKAAVELTKNETIK